MTRYDAVIIGAGAGGAAAAWRLCQNGLHVLILEAGPRFEPAHDYPLTEPGWERRSFPVKPGSRGQFTYGDLGRCAPKDRDLSSWSVVWGGPVADPARQPSNVGYAHVQGVGGSTLHYVGEAHRMNPRSMRLRSDHGAGEDWPVLFHDLVPHYEVVEQVVGVAGAPQIGSRWPDVAHLQPAHPISTSSHEIMSAGARLGMQWVPNTRAALSVPKDGRPACNYCANCARGCPLGDKGSADVTFLRHAELTGRLTIETGASVTQIVADQNATRIQSVVYVQNGKEVRIDVPLLILAAGAVQTPRLLLASAAPSAPGLANGSGQVGRNFIETLAWVTTGLKSGLTASHKGLPADAVCWDFNDPDSIVGAVGGCRFTAATQEIGFVGPVAYATRLIDGFGASFKQRMRSELGSAISVAATGEVIPDERSFIGLDPSQKDPFGVPVAQINSVLTDNSIALLRFMAETCRKVIAEAGVTTVLEELSVWDRFTSTHVFGTCRMGDQSDTSVVDPFGRAHDIDNLYITDASVFPTGGGGEAPVSTIQALALRTADRIVA